MLLRIAMHASFIVLVLLLFVLSIGSAFAHDGGIDACGGHNDNRNGN